ncbi:MAG TPA: hypothetical protein VGC72_00125 [Candidatus Elarobacter sp.]
MHAVSELRRESGMLSRTSELAKGGSQCGAPGERPNAPCWFRRQLFGASHLAKRRVAVAVVGEEPRIENLRLQARDRRDFRRGVPGIAYPTPVGDRVCTRDVARAQHQFECGDLVNCHLREIGVTLTALPVRVESAVEEGERITEAMLRQRDEPAQLSGAHGDDVNAGGFRQDREALRLHMFTPRPMSEGARVRDLGTDRTMHAAHIGLHRSCIENFKSAVDRA